MNTPDPDSSAPHEAAGDRGGSVAKASQTRGLKTPGSVEAGSSDPARRRIASTLIKVAVTVALYVAVFYKIDVDKMWSHLQAVRPGWIALGILAYAAGQWLSAWRWWLLLRPVQLTVPYLRMVAFYFIGMFFNHFLPTIVGGDAVKAILLARETGAPAR